jgi:hypothetical protein
MVQCTPQNREMQEQRLKIKQFGQQMQNWATAGPVFLLGKPENWFGS